MIEYKYSKLAKIIHMSITGRGAHSRSRRRLTLRVGEHGQIKLKKMLQEFKEGDRVLIDPTASVQRNIPHRRFFGISGIVIKKKGRAYSIAVGQGASIKTVDLLPVHLKRL
jgi:large subunit ribosomal protein L21e